MTKREEFIKTVLLAFQKEVIKKIVFSRPRSSDVVKISARLCAHRSQKILSFEYSLPGNTVSHKNITESQLEKFLSELLSEYRQSNLITTAGDVEWKLSKSEKEALLGSDALQKKLVIKDSAFEKAVDSLDKKKNYILSGKERFLIALAISDSTGRVHDKKQGKFRQINRFIEHVEDVYKHLPQNGTLNIFDLCCGKSYLSFAVYYYLTEVKCRHVRMLGIDLKRDVILWCDDLARQLGYNGMTFICDDIKNVPTETKPDMVISLHACDVATDIVIDSAIRLDAKVILSTPCCHKYLNGKINNPDLKFVTSYPHLAGKVCEAFTDAIRVARLKKNGYTVSAIELTDPENTPKNTLIKAIKQENFSSEAKELFNREYEAILSFLLGDAMTDYLDFKN